MNFEEFLPKEEPAAKKTKTVESENETIASTETAAEVEAEDENGFDEIHSDIQQKVIEDFAAEKAEMEEVITNLRKTIVELRSHLAKIENQLTLKTEELQKTGDILAANSEKGLSNMVTLLERNPNLSDRFEGESRDQVIEVLREARDAAEQGGRNRRAQILESVLLVNEPNGILAKKRNELIKLFTDNGNIINGTVMEALKKLDISHKNGEEYLLPSEIVARNY